MKKIHLASAMLLGALCVLAASPCLAQTSTTQETASNAFKSVYGGPSADDKQVALNIATASLQAARGGFGPGNTIIGTVDTTNNYNGTVTNYNSGATNSVNSNTTTSTITATGGSDVTLEPTTTQSSGSASQAATSGTFNGGTDNDITKK
jgi:hypothetical protein